MDTVSQGSSSRLRSPDGPQKTSQRPVRGTNTSWVRWLCSGADGGEAPLDDPGAALDVGGNQLAALLGQVEHHGGRFGNGEAVVVDDWHLAEGADPPVGVAVELAAGVIERMDPIRQADLLERPLRAQVLGLADSAGEDVCEGVERDHALIQTRSRPRKPRAA